MEFKEGDILEFDGMGPYAAEKGATAICKGYYTRDDVEYIQVIWHRDKFSHGQMDGGYHASHFTKIGEVSTQKEDRILKENKKLKEMKFKKGDILEVVDKKGLSVEKGETATCNGCIIDGDGDLLVQVIWNKIKSFHSQMDGGYFEYHFEKIGELKDLKEDRIFEEKKEKVMEKENRNMYFTFNFDEGKERVIKMLEEDVENFIHDMLMDVRSVINEDRDETVDQIESIITDIRMHERFIKETIEKVKESTTVLEILGAMENTSFEEEEETVLCALFGLMSITREG